MNKFLGFNLIAAVLLMVSSCKDNGIVSEINKNKPAPSIEAKVIKKQYNDFSITLLHSSDAMFYGFVILEGKDNEAPSAYDIVNGKCSTRGINSGFFSVANNSSATRQIKTRCTYSENYQVFSAAMNSEGRFSKIDTLLINIPGAAPGVSVREGYYMVKGIKYRDVENPNTGTPFPIRIKKWSKNPNKYLALANWFNFVDKGKAFGPYLLGTVDYEKMILVFDGKIVDSQENLYEDVTAFGTMFIDYDQKSSLAFWSGGDGDNPIECYLNSSGQLISISALRYAIHDKKSKKKTGYFDAVPNGTPLEYIGEKLE